MSGARRWTRGARRLAGAHPVAATALVLQTVAALVALGMLFAGQGRSFPLISADHFEMRVAFRDAGGLKEKKHPPVTVAGVMSGSVTKVRYERGLAIATLRLKENAKGKIFKDARALVTPRSALNDLTVDVEPGTPAAGRLAPGSTIAATRTTGPVNLDRLAGVLDLDTRANLVALVSELGTALDHRGGALGAAVAELGPLVNSSDTVARQLARRRALLKQLVPELRTVFATLARRGRDVRTVLSAGDRALAAVGREQKETASAVRQLAPALTGVGNAMQQIEALGEPLRPALARLDAFATALPGALKALRDVSPEGQRLVTDLNALARTGETPLRELQALAGRLRSASPRLTPSVRRFEPVVRDIDRNKIGIGQFGSNFSGVFSNQNANGGTLRAYGFFEAPRPENLGFPATAAGRVKATLRLAQALELVCGRNVVACIARFTVPGLPSTLTMKRPTFKRQGG